MRKVMIALIVCVLMASLAFAYQQTAQGAQVMPGADGTEAEDADAEEIETEDETEAEVETEETELEVEDELEDEETPLLIQTRTQERVKAGDYTTEDGKKLQIQEQTNNRIQLKADNVAAETALEMVQEQSGTATKLQVKLSNGRNAEVKVMPSTASATALERLRLHVCSAENNCTIELKEVGTGNQTRAAYEVQVEKQSRFLGIFKTKMKVKAQVDAENGEVIQTKKPWWAFLASEAEEAAETEVETTTETEETVETETETTA